MGHFLSVYFFFASHHMGDTKHDSPSCVDVCKRWYILCVFSCFAFCHGLAWGVYGPISESIENRFGWSDSTIAQLTNWGPIMSIATTPFWVVILDQHNGLRTSVLIGAFAIMLACALRCVHIFWWPEIWLCHLSQVLVGTAGRPATAAAGKLSNDWFPPHQRTTATAITSMGTWLGFATSFLIGPYMVDAQGNGMELLMIVEFVVVCASALAVLLYFPSYPSVAPSISAGHRKNADPVTLRTLAVNCWQLLHIRSFVVLIVVFGMCTGMYDAWAALLNINLKPLGYSEITCGWLGFLAILFGAIGGVGMGMITDYLRHHRVVLIALLVISASACALFTLQINGVLPNRRITLFASAILGGSAVNAGIPLFFELCIEAAYPAPQGIAGILLTVMNPVGTMLFLLVPIDSLGTAWMNWTVTAVPAIGAFLILFAVQNIMNRYEVDMSPWMDPQELLAAESDYRDAL
eukprot:NODE_336_length_1770_cov_360.094131_g272_i0.p1 GENE.NODE_336_length_1770_cov_360.094131_g272_i0~~NODE_336_length_1770_cov_360.094131_g272_i0.p1  ORF type:complete len:464 (-),score=84.69 NODE_336_length_1770_cov_360.094131_g272_i0:97-1488(-)